MKEIPGIVFRSLGPKMTKEEFGDVKRLMGQVSDKNKRILKRRLEKRIKDGHINITLAKAINGQIVVMASLVLNATIAEDVGRVEDVVTEKSYRGLGLGEAVMERLIVGAKLRGISHLLLTSKPEREAANRLYLKLGFELLGFDGRTNHYRLKL